MNERFLIKRWSQNSQVFLFQILLGAFVLCVHTSWICRLVAEDTKSSAEYFGIQVVDSQTQRGVPLVQLKTVNGLTYVTDSAGWVAFNEPGLMDSNVYFRVSSHGYEYPADGLGIRGVRLNTQRGETVQLKITRKNLAERLYRITGQGIYRDSVLLDKCVPIKNPTINAQVLGQDTVQVTKYRQRLHWFWGDTTQPSYPLGNFKTSGATSLFPQNGGLDPALGVNLDYFVNHTGFSRPMAPIEGEGVVWLHGLFALHLDGTEKMFAHYTRLKSLGKQLEHGLVIYNDKKKTFEKLVRFEDDALLFPRGQSLVNEHGIDGYVYFCNPFPSIRVKADLASIKDPSQYESYTCLKKGTTYQLELPKITHDKTGKLLVDAKTIHHRIEAAPPEIDRNSDGSIRWAWKQNTGALDASMQRQLIRSKHLKPEEAKLTVLDRDGQTTIHLHAGSVHWNAYRRRWIMIAAQLGGKSSFLGEIWYAEAEHLEGPWENARHIITHDKYSFYNPTQHPFFDQEGGRFIYLEGTYTSTFSAAKIRTPRYDYNQIMYRLDLANPQLKLPAENQ